MPNERPRVLIWLDPAQLELARHVAREALIDVSAVGVSGPATTESIGAAFPGAAVHSDWRAAVNGSDVDAVVMLSMLAADTGPGGAKLIEIDEGELQSLCRGKDVRLMTTEPIPSSLHSLGAMDGSESERAPMIVPLFMHAPVMQDVIEMSASLGIARSLSISLRCGPAQVSLGAKLFEAMHIVHSLLGVPEVIDASVVTPSARPSLRLAPSESLRMLRGDLTANLRYSGPQSASLALSDRAGRWFRGVMFIAENGSLRVSDSALEHFDSEGRMIDAPESRSSAVEEHRTAIEVAAGAIAEGVRRGLDPHSARHAPIDAGAVLSMCEAAMLSARTGQPESPEMLMRMVR